MNKSSVSVRFLGTFLRLAAILVLAALPLAGLPAQTAIAAPPEKPLLDAPPSVSLDVPPTAFIGENVSFTVTFDNTDTAPGYGPLIDLVIPTNGVDGPPSPDGLAFLSATYLGSNIEHTVLTVPAGGCIAHPYMMDGITQAPVQVCGLTPGDTFVALRLPFGSFTPDQPPLTVTVNTSMSNLADLGTPLTIQARGAYQYGYNPLDDFYSDDPVATLSAWGSSSVTPTLFTLEKTYSGPEDETATGPNYPRQYTVTAQIAPGQSLSPFTLTDILPGNMQFISLISPVSGCTTPSTVTPGGTLSCAFASASGTVSMTFSYYIPLRDLIAASVIDPATGDDVLSCNNASASGTWTPIDGRDLPASTQTIDEPVCEHTLTDKSIATQKGVAVVDGFQPAPGRILEYTVDIQVSDFFAFDQVLVTDTFSDGQRWDTTFAPTLQILGNPALLNSAGNFDAANYTVDISQIGNSGTPGDGTDGSTTVTFRISDEMISRPSADGRLIGGCLPAAGTPGDPDCGTYNNGATTARIVFRTVIQENFSDTFPSGDASVDQGDVLNNIESVAGRILSTSNAATLTGSTEADGSAASVTIERGTLSKAVYAVNDVHPAPSPVRVASGDTVTFQLTYTLTTSDFEALVLTDYLPLPTFSATRVTGHNNTVCGVPAAGTSCLGPSDTYHSLPGAVNPALTNDGSSNWVRWTYGNYDSTSNQPSTIDLLFTVTVEKDPFADNMHLTNQAYATEGSTNGDPGESAAIVEITFTAPVMTITKSAVATNALAPTFTPALPIAFTPPESGAVRWSGMINSNLLTTTPIDSDVSGLDAGDLVTFAIFLVNEGSGINGAFDITISDSFDTAGFEFPTLGDPTSLNLQIYYGNGLGPSIPYTGTAGDLFGAGIKLVDPSGSGAAAAYDPVSGNNVIVITYDLRLLSNVVPGTYLNTATLESYSGSEGGPSFLPQPISDDATVTTDDPLLTKTLVGTGLDNLQNSSTQVVIGELLTYTLSLTLPEGSLPAAQIVDTLDAGLAFLDLSSVTFSNPDADGAGPGDDGIYSSVMTFDAGGSCTNCTAGTTPGSNPLISAFGGQNGRRITFNFGDMVNTNRDNNVDETITITYRAVVLNVVGNQSGGLRNNSAALTWTGDSLPAVSAPNVTIIEPVINTVKSVSPATADAGDTVTFTVTLSNPASASTTAYDVTWSDTLPAALTYAPATLALGLCTASMPLTLSDAGAPTLSASGGLFQPGESCVITFSATIGYSAAPGQVITNTAITQWTSLSGVVSEERTGAGGVDDYASQGSAAVTISSVQPQKSLVSTSELSTGTPRVAIGEIVRYRLVVQLPEGTSANFQIRDNLPSGLTYLDDGTARLALLSNGTPIASSNPTGDTLGLGLGSGPFATGPWVNGNDPTTPLVTPAFVLPDQNTGSTNSITADPPDTYATGTRPFFKLGTLTNNDSDADAEYVIVEFNALVDNTAAGSNDAGDNRNNTFSVFINGTQNGPDSNPVPVTIAEPALTLAKTAVIDPTRDAGDSVTYTLAITSASGVNRATAFELNLVDNFDANLTGLAVSGVVPTQGATCTGNGASVTAFSHNGGVFAGNSLTFTATCLDPGQTITLTITGTVAATAPAGYTIPNTATLGYTSLPGTGTVGNLTGSDTPGGSGAGNGERDGSGTPALNDYAASASAPLTLSNPLVDKLDPVPSQYVIGDLVTFNIRVTLPEGLTPALQVVDDLPPGLEYVSHQVITAAASSGAILAADFNGTLPVATFTVPSGSGGDLTLLFGDTTTTDDNNITNNAFLVRVVARVLNVAGNQNGTVLTNTANVTWTGGSASDFTTISLLEPVLTIQKTADTTAWVYGQTVTFTISLENLAANLSAADARDVVVSDTIPAGLTYVPASITTPGSCVASAVAPNLTWKCASVPLGTTLNLTYQVTVNSPPTAPFLTANDTVTNTASTTWTSQSGDNNPGAEGGERDGSGGVNDYSDSDTETGALVYYSLGNRVWFDTDNNRQIDFGAEVGVDGVQVELYYDDGTGNPGAPVFELDGVTPRSDLTTNGGYYLFDYLPAGEYVVVIPASNFAVSDVLEGYWSSGASRNNDGLLAEVGAPDPDNDLDSDDNGSTSLSGAVVAQPVTLGGLPAEPTSESDLQGGTPPVGQGEQPDARANMTVDFGFYTIQLGNQVWQDIDNSGLLDGAEAGIDGVIVELWSADGLFLLGTTTTQTVGPDAGLYTFTGLPQGSYIVRLPQVNFSAPAGVLQNYYSSTGGTGAPYEPAPNPDGDQTDSDDNGSEVGSLAGGGYIQSAIFALTPQAEQTFDHNQGLTTEFRVDFGVLKMADLSITKDDGGTNYAPGASLTYTIVVSNAGPSDVIGATVSDTLPAQIGSWAWTCVTSGGATCAGSAGSITTDFNDTVNMPSGSTITYTVVAQVLSSATGALTNIATVSPPAGITDPTPANNTDDDTDTQASQADLSITKDDGVATYTPGASLTYTIVVNNAGPSDVSGATVSDVRPAQIGSWTWTCVTTGGATCAGSAGSITTDFNETVNMPSGSSITYTVVAQVLSSATGVLTNTATVVAPTGVTDPTPGNNTDDDTDTQDSQADLSITKDDGVTSYVPGASLTYTIVVNNAGPSDVSGATVSDARPAQIGSWTWTCVTSGGATCAGSPGSITTNFSDTVNMPSGSSITYTVVAQVLSSATGALLNTATVVTPTGVMDPTPANNTDDDTDTQDSQADLSITKDDGVATYTPGASLTYTIVVNNAGPSDVSGATVSDARPTQIGSWTWTCVTTGGATCAGSPGSITTNFSDTVNMPSGSSITYTVVAQVLSSATGDLLNTAIVLAPLGVTDPTPGNNTDDDTDTQDSQADLSITKDDGVTSYVPGANLTYTIVVNNAGPSDVSGATVSDARPAQIGSWAWTCVTTGGATCAGSPGSITTDFNDTVNMPAGSSITYTVVAQVLSSATGDLLNTATVAAPADITDPTPGNNTDDDTDTQNPLVDLSVTKSDGQDFYLAGGTLTYTIVVSNGGPSDVVGATVTDTLPTQIDSWSWVCTSQAGGANGCDPYTGSADFSDTVNLPVGGSITYTVTANLAASATGLLTNTVTIAPPTGYTDPTPDNNSADDVDQPASLTITKDDGLTIVAPGSLITYTIQLTNPGAVDLTSITVTDILPPELSYQSATPVPTTAPAPGSAGGTITWTGVSLALGANTTFTVTAQVDPSLPTGGSLTNTVSVEDTNTGLSDSADDTDLILIDVNNGKSILDTNEPTTTLPNVAIGEIVTYQISIDVPASSTLTNLRALDVLDSGLAFVRCVRIDPGSLTTTLPGGFGDACNDPTNPTVAVEPIGDPSQINQGRRIQFDLGSVSNSSSSDIRLLVEYEVVVLNIPANVDGVGGLNNTVLWTWDGGSLSAVAPPLEIVEPQMSIVKDATPTVAPYGATITFSLDIAHTLESTADAFDVVVTDVLPPGLAFIPGTVSTTGLAPDLIDYVGTSLTFVWNVFPLNATALLTFQATFVGPAPVVNTADLAWTSLPIDPGLGGAPIEQSPYNDYSTERYYDPPAANGVNNYGTSSSVSITVPSLPATGFVPGRLTALPAQPADKAYTALLGGAWLEIPDLGLSLPILSVPVSSTGWDLTWLSNQAGYLAGTTLPGNVGTTGLTAHVTLADGTPGPFRNLSRLYWGNKVILHADGYRYLYEVRESRTVLPRDLSVLKQDGYTWLTLLTCEGYVPWLDTYNYRLAVRAVLLSVEPDSAATPFPAQPARLPEQRETSR